MADHNLIIAVDPGLTSGVAVFDTSTGKVQGLEMDMARLFEFMSNLSSGDIVVCEDFVARPGIGKMSRQYETLWIIGALRYVSQVAMVRLVFQSPAEAKSWADRERLKRFGLSC